MILRRAEDKITEPPLLEAITTVTGARNLAVWAPGHHDQFCGAIVRLRVLKFS